MKVASPSSQVTSAHFRQRAIHYRLAAAVSDTRRDVEMFLDLATMFEQLSAGGEAGLPETRCSRTARSLLNGTR